MSRFATYPTLFNECKTLSITFLNQHGYLNPNQHKSGTVTWSRHGSVTGKIGIAIRMYSTNGYLELDYTCNDQPINYIVELVSIPSNIGKGVIWYFVCPHTGKQCRILHLVDGYFYHRSAFKWCFYESQTHSHKNRDLLKLFEMASPNDEFYFELYKKHAKKTYAGKPTKRYLRLSRKLAISERFSIEDIERMYCS